MAFKAFARPQYVVALKAAASFGGYRFRIDPCPPHDWQKKGVVEAGGKYVKGNILPLGQLRDLSDLNAQVRARVMIEAGQRCHSTTRVAPLKLFTLERPHLQPLPDQAPDLGSWHQISVHRDCHVKFDHCLYSAPLAWVGNTLWLRATDSSVLLFHDHLLVASHARSLHPGQRMTVHDHMPPKARWFFAHDGQWLEQHAYAIGASCLQLIERLLSDRIVERLLAAQCVFALAKTYGAWKVLALGPWRMTARITPPSSPSSRAVPTASPWRAVLPSRSTRSIASFTPPPACSLPSSPSCFIETAAMNPIPELRPQLQ